MFSLETATEGADANGAGADANVGDADANADGEDVSADGCFHATVRGNALKSKDEDRADGADAKMRLPPGSGNGGMPPGGVCAQCGEPPDGREEFCALGDETVWLHPECQRAYVNKGED